MTFTVYVWLILWYKILNFIRISWNSLRGLDIQNPITDVIIAHHFHGELLAYYIILTILRLIKPVLPVALLYYFPTQSHLVLVIPPDWYERERWLIGVCVIKYAKFHFESKTCFSVIGFMMPRACISTVWSKTKIWNSQSRWKYYCLYFGVVCL